MTTVAPSPGTTAVPDQKASRWTRRSLWMLPTFVAAYVVTSLVGEYVMLPWLGLHEGDLMLMKRGVAGWASEIVFASILVAPAALGLVFAVAALRHGGRWRAWLGLALNAVLVVLVLYMFVDAIHMTYHPTASGCGSDIHVTATAPMSLRAAGFVAAREGAGLRRSGA